MSRKDYIAAAEILRAVSMPDPARAELVSRFVTFFADDSPRFSPSRFRAASEPVAGDARAALERARRAWSRTQDQLDLEYEQAERIAHVLIER
jgi:hypothetical protein